MHCISLYHGHDQVRGHQNVFKVQSDDSWKHGRLWWLLWLFLWRSYVSWCINRRFPSISLFGLLCCLSHLPEGEKPESGTGTPPQPIGQRISFSIQALPQMHAAASSCSCLRSEFWNIYIIYNFIIFYIYIKVSPSPCAARKKGNPSDLGWKKWDANLLHRQVGFWSRQQHKLESIVRTVKPGRW